MQPGFHRAQLGFVVLGLSDVVELQHSAEHMGASYFGRLRIGHRIDHGGGGGNSCQRCHLGHGQLVQCFAEIHFGRRADSVGALPEKNLVDVQGEDLFLGKFGLHQQGNVDLAHLAFHIAPRREKHVAGDLHGDGTRALTNAAGSEVGHSGPQDPLPINTVVPEETIVLGGEEGLDRIFAAGWS